MARVRRPFNPMHVLEWSEQQFIAQGILSGHGLPLHELWLMDDERGKSCRMRATCDEARVQRAFALVITHLIALHQLIISSYFNHIACQIYAWHQFMHMQCSCLKQGH